MRSLTGCPEIGVHSNVSLSIDAIHLDSGKNLENTKKIMYYVYMIKIREPYKDNGIPGKKSSDVITNEIESFMKKINEIDPTIGKKIKDGDIGLAFSGSQLLQALKIDEDALYGLVKSNQKNKKQILIDAIFPAVESCINLGFKKVNITSSSMRNQIVNPDFKKIHNAIDNLKSPFRYWFYLFKNASTSDIYQHFFTTQFQIAIGQDLKDIFSHLDRNLPTNSKSLFECQLFGKYFGAAPLLIIGAFLAAVSTPFFASIFIIPAVFLLFDASFQHFMDKAAEKKDDLSKAISKLVLGERAINIDIGKLDSNNLSQLSNQLFDTSVKFRKNRTFSILSSVGTIVSVAFIYKPLIVLFPILFGILCLKASDKRLINVKIQKVLAFGKSPKLYLTSKKQLAIGMMEKCKKFCLQRIPKSKNIN